MKEEKWLTDLQSYANKCTFWGFACVYPWKHPCVPANMKDNMTLLADGGPMVRLRVLEGGKRYRLLQYHFEWYIDGKNHPSASGLLLRAMQRRVWKQSWDADITEKQLREYMRLIGKVSWFELKDVAKLVDAGEEIPEKMINSLAVSVQNLHKKALDKG